MVIRGWLYVPHKAPQCSKTWASFLYIKDILIMELWYPIIFGDNVGSGLVLFYEISTLVGYLISNPVQTHTHTHTYIYIYHHVVPLAQISLTLSRYFSLSFIVSGTSLGLHPVSSHSCCMYVLAGRPTFAWPYAGSIGVRHLYIYIYI